MTCTSNESARYNVWHVYRRNPFITIYTCAAQTGNIEKYRQLQAHYRIASIDILTYLLTPWCRVLLEKLTGLQLVKKIPAFYGTRRFITALTSVRHLSPSWASPIQSTYPHLTSWRSIPILSTHLRLGLPSGLFPSSFPTKILHAPLSSPISATCPAYLLIDILTKTNSDNLYQDLVHNQKGYELRKFIAGSRSHRE